MLADEGGAHRNTMRLVVPVKHSLLLETVKKNLAQHKAEYALAMVGWRKTLVEQLESSVGRAQDMLQKAKDGNDDAKWMKGLVPNRMVPSDWHDEPVSYESAYQSAVDMLEMSAEENATIKLDRTLFQQLVQNQWDWSAGVAITNRKYSGTGQI